MRFNIERFLDETGGNLDVIFDCIDALTEVIDKYIKDDEDASGNGFGCYNCPEAEVKDSMLNSCVIEFLDC